MTLQGLRFLGRRLFSSKIGRINHVAYATKDANKAVSFYRDVLGLSPQPEHGVFTTFVDFGNTKLEFLEPLGEEGPIHGFMERNPRGGIHHLCYEVDDLQAVVARLAEKGIKPLAPPKIGAHGNPVVFLHPRDCHGILTELEEVCRKEDAGEKTHS